MTWRQLSLNEWRRRPLRTCVTAAGVAIAVAAMFSLLAFHEGYRDGIKSELDRLGAHVLVVPKGCPYDAASTALHGANWPCFLNERYFDEIAATHGVASAAPAFMAAPASNNGTQTVYVGVDDKMLALRLGWRMQGAFPSADGEILSGSETARLHQWKVGQRIALPDLPGEHGIVSGILEPTRGQDDVFIYARLPDAQRWFHKSGQLTHILVKLSNVNLLDTTVTALRGCDAGMEMNVVPMAHLFQTIQALVNSTRVLLGCLALIGLIVAAAGVSNALLMSVTERNREIGIMRALGASRRDVFRLILLEALQVCAAGGVVGISIAFLSSQAIEAWLRSRLPFSPTDALIRWDWTIAVACLGGSLLVGCLAALLPAWRAIELSPVKAMREGARA